MFCPISWKCSVIRAYRCKICSQTHTEKNWNSAIALLQFNGHPFPVTDNNRKWLTRSPTGIQVVEMQSTTMWFYWQQSIMGNCKISFVHNKQDINCERWEKVCPHWAICVTDQYTNTEWKIQYVKTCKSLQIHFRKSLLIIQRCQWSEIWVHFAVGQEDPSWDNTSLDKCFGTVSRLNAFHSDTAANA